MLSANEVNLIERIHASGRQLVVAATGGGSGAISALLEVPGASASVLGAIVPYAERALAAWLGGRPDHACSERTARAMAMAAFERARTFTETDPRSLAGVGVTASLATTRPKRGAHRIHVAWQTADATASVSCQLAKGDRTRAEEEIVATHLVLDAVAEACGVAGEPLTTAAIGETIQRRELRAPAAWSELLLNERSTLAVEAISSEQTPQLLFPGAFNPLHAGHREMARIASARYGLPVTYELSITNVDKPPLDFLELDERLGQFGDDAVLITRAATFVEKATLAPDSIFIVGVDTLARIADDRYYGDDAARRDEAIAAIAAQGCRFLVFGRQMAGGFSTLGDLDLPAGLAALCEELSEREFRADISSTELRGE